jgi:gluconokinase
MIVLVMGVAGSGKTTVARALAEQLGYRFVDADDFHSPASVDKMRRGVPLDETDRKPWLDTVAAHLHGDVVVACSALKEAHRARLKPAHVVFLNVPPQVLATRLANRPGHFLDPALLQSQLETLEPPHEAIEAGAAPDIASIAALIRSR